MKRYTVLFCTSVIILNLLIHPAICDAKSSTASKVEVRVVFLPPRAAIQEHASIKSFREITSHDEFAPSFQRIDDAGLKGEWYVAKQIPMGGYEVRVSIGTGEPDIVRVVRIESRSNTLYFGSDVTSAHIVVVDPLGDIVKNVVVDKVVDSFGTDYAAAFSSASSARIPFGIYQVEVRAREFGIATGKFCFCTPESWSVLGVGVPGGDAVYPDATVRLKGSIQASNSITEPMIVRLAPAYMSSSMAVVISPGSDGKFALSGALPAAGDYVLLVSQAGRILGSKVLRLPLSNAVSFRLDTGVVISFEADGPVAPIN